LKVIDENTRIRIRCQGYGSADPNPYKKCHGSATLINSISRRKGKYVSYLLNFSVYGRKENAELRARVADLEARGSLTSDRGSLTSTNNSLQDTEGNLPPLAPLELPHFDFNVKSTD
jgi:hypothetical protein